MLIFDQIRKNDAQLQLLAMLFCGGLAVLLAGLWWVQIVNASRYRTSVETQSFRTVRLAAVRGKILDRNGVALADNRPSYNVSLYLEELSNGIEKDYRVAKKEFRKNMPLVAVTNKPSFLKGLLGFSGVKTQQMKLTDNLLLPVKRGSRYRVANAVVGKVSNVIQTPLVLNYTNFTRHYETARSMPFCVVSNLSPLHVARFEEQAGNSLGVDLEIQSKRSYPHSNTAAHVIGYVRSDDSSAVGEDAYFSYRTPDYRGLVGIEGGHDQTLRGRAGAKSVQVNNLGYRQAENIWDQVVPGTNIVLTLDLEVQRETEAALRKQTGHTGRGAVVVMDVRSGDILALASNPTFSPNQFAHGISRRDYQQLQEITAEKNRATAEQYQAGSIFKTIIALAALENGLDKNRVFQVDPNPQNSSRGAYSLGNRIIKDTAPPGDYNLSRAIVRSSNSYFVQIGLLPNVFEKVLQLGKQLHLGEKFDPDNLPLRQQAAGNFPSVASAKTISAGEKANICIGQGAMDVTPMQIAVMMSAIANGGTVLKPRMVDRLESQDPVSIEPPTIFPRGQVRDRLAVSMRSLKILHEAMLLETEDQVEGTGRHVQPCGFRVCGKTGTAELQSLREDGQKKNTTWFASFAPYESPRYTVIVMVENGQSGGMTCAPIARDVYVALKSFETRNINGAITATTR